MYIRQQLFKYQMTCIFVKYLNSDILDSPRAILVTPLKSRRRL
jgi:hypothetical protein